MTTGAPKLTSMLSDLGTVVDHAAVDYLPAITTDERISASSHESTAVDYFRRCGYELKRIAPRDWSLEALPDALVLLAEDFRPKLVSGHYCSIQKIWRMWEVRYIQHLLTIEIERWIERMVEHGSPSDSAAVREWVAREREGRLPHHLHDDLDIAIMGPVLVPKRWRVLAAQAAVSRRSTDRA